MLDILDRLAPTSGDTTNREKLLEKLEQCSVMFKIEALPERIRDEARARLAELADIREQAARSVATPAQPEHQGISKSMSMSSDSSESIMSEPSSQETPV
jgi:hypothetical protein